jgi:hypothetical protein
MTTIWFDQSIGEHVGLDVLQREHFGQTFAACLERVMEANQVIAKDMLLQPENYTLDNFQAQEYHVGARE